MKCISPGRGEKQLLQQNTGGKTPVRHLLMWVDIIYRTLAMTMTVMIDLQLESLSEKYMCNSNTDLQLCYFYPGYVFVII